jgi:hypothetical protein
MMMFGPTYLAKTVLMSIFMGSLFLFVEHQRGTARAYCGSDSILRGLIFTVIFQNPSASFYLFPLPIQIPAWGIAAVLLAVDLIGFNVAAFGGTSASWVMLNYFL